MCVSFSRRQEMERFPERFQWIRRDGVLAPNPDHRPGDEALVVVETRRGRSVQAFRWGFIPSWWRTDEAPPDLIYNARMETAASKPTFRRSWARRRCVVPVDAFHEWHRRGDGRCYRVSRVDGRGFGLAGLWDDWRGPDGRRFFLFTLLTAPANALVAPVHHRMPMVLDAELEDWWLRPGPLAGAGPPSWDGSAFVLEPVDARSGAA